MICAQVGEDSALSAPATIDLSTLLVHPVINITELSLTAAQYKAQMKPPVAWKEGPLLGSASAGEGGQHMKQYGTASKMQQPAAAKGSRHRDFDTGAAADVDKCYAASASAAAGQHVRRWATDLSPHTEQGGQGDQQQHQATSRLRHLHQQRAEQHLRDVNDAARPAMEEGAYNIWDHSGDKLPVVELFPMEIRTFELTLPEQV